MNMYRSALRFWLVLIFVLAGPVTADDEVASGSELLQKVLDNNPGAFSDANQQIVLVASEKPGDVLAKIYTFEKVDGQWKDEFGVMDASGGRTGFAAFDEKEEGDGHAPSGIFALERAFGYDKKETARTRLDYKQATKLDYWIDDVDSEHYNTWQRLDAPQPPDAKHNEALLRKDRLYRYAIIVEYNTKKPVPGKGSAIFIHWERSPGAPTAGCIATSRENMLSLFKWLDPKKKPVIVMGNEPELVSQKWYEG